MCALVVLTALAGCSAPAANAGRNATTASACATTGCASGATPPATTGAGLAPCVAPSCAATNVQVFVEPDAGEAPILRAIRSARQSVWVEVYILSDNNVLRALEAAATRGVDVRALLEPHPFGGGDVTAQKDIEELNAAGAQARPSDPAYYYTHEKALLIDGATAYILTANLSKTGLGGSSGGANREYGVIDTDPGDVAQIRAIFEADWGHTVP
ncbi:MAG TPA: phospholipase D-like domain-containing protein, partial [Ktedonobacterales bacterium]|nr:phospholipase D-like domain-containing protein [Ktedonobacterales bacterium]